MDSFISISIIFCLIKCSLGSPLYVIKCGSELCDQTVDYCETPEASICAPCGDICGTNPLPICRVQCPVYIELKERDIFANNIVDRVMQKVNASLTNAMTEFNWQLMAGSAAGACAGVIVAVMILFLCYIGCPCFRRRLDCGSNRKIQSEPSVTGSDSSISSEPNTTTDKTSDPLLKQEVHVPRILSGVRDTQPVEDRQFPSTTTDVSAIDGQTAMVTNG